ncbi:MAG TPA: FkbM family methyltransferase [Rhodanobacteraceae bacterium]|nr:FkbM family methyltransferase [Rhodanobacteraceae bacterium]
MRAVRASWRCRQGMNFVVKTDDVLVPMAGGIGLELLDDEADVTPVLRHFYRAGCRGAVVDIGANIGLVLLALIKIDRRVPYIGIEPSVQAAAYIQRLITLNNLAATHSVYAVASSDECGAAALQTSGAHDVSATIDSRLRPSGMYRTRTAVCVSTGDLLLRDVASIDVIKIDVEGNECRVLAGLVQTIQRHRPALIVEIMPYYHLVDDSYSRAYFGNLSESERMQLASNRRANMEALGAFMTQHGYDLYQMRNGALHAAQPSESTVGDQDFVAIPRERSNWFGIVPKEQACA